MRNLDRAVGRYAEMVVASGVEARGTFKTTTGEMLRGIALHAGVGLDDLRNRLESGVDKALEVFVRNLAENVPEGESISVEPEVMNAMIIALRSYGYSTFGIGLFLGFEPDET